MNNQREILALIPARKGSKSIKNKNLITILDKPLIFWSIDLALKSKYITRTIVSTNSKKIKKISEKFGAEVPFLRPDEISRDNSLDIEAFTHALDWLRKNENYKPDLVVHLRPTGPARRVSLVDQAIKLIMKEKNADSLRSVSTAKQTPFKMWYMDNKYIDPIIKNSDELHSKPRQKLRKVFWQNGYVDITKPKTIIKKKSMVGKYCIGFEIKEEVVDIDYPEDIEIVANKLKEIQNNSPTKNKYLKNRYPV